MVTRSKKIEDRIKEAFGNGKDDLIRFESVKGMAKIVMDKSNGFMTSRGHAKIEGTGNFLERFLTMLDQAGGLQGAWTLIEVKVKKSYVLFFDKDEQEVMDDLEKYIVVSDVMTA